jgi:transposase-like protein
MELIDIEQIICPRTGKKDPKTGIMYHRKSDGQNIVKHGFGSTIHYGHRQRFKCQICAHTFYDKSVLGDKQMKEEK